MTKCEDKIIEKKIKFRKGSVIITQTKHEDGISQEAYSLPRKTKKK